MALTKTAEQVREAMGLLTAAEWDAGTGDLETLRRYMETSEHTANDAIRGLIIICRALMANLGEERNMTRAQVLQHTAARVAEWQ